MHCLVCQHGDDTVPLITFRYRGESFSICSQHLPVLIHDPARLMDKLPGADQLRPSETPD